MVFCDGIWPFSDQQKIEKAPVVPSKGDPRATEHENGGHVTAFDQPKVDVFYLVGRKG